MYALSRRAWARAHVARFNGAMGRALAPRTNQCDASALRNRAGQRVSRFAEDECAANYVDRLRRLCSRRSFSRRAKAGDARDGGVIDLDAAARSPALPD